MTEITILNRTVYIGVDERHLPVWVQNGDADDLTEEAFEIVSLIEELQAKTPDDTDVTLDPFPALGFTYAKRYGTDVGKAAAQEACRTLQNVQFRSLLDIACTYLEAFLRRYAIYDIDQMPLDEQSAPAAANRFHAI